VSDPARTRTRSRAAAAPSRSDPASSGFRIADYPFYLVNRIAGRYGMYMSAALKAIGMDLPTWRALMILHERSPRSVSEIADQSVVQRMKRNGLVRLATRRSDARVTEVAITARGSAAVRRVREVAARMFERSFAGFTEQELQALNRLLGRVLRNLGRGP